MSWPLCSLCQQVFFPIVCVFFFLHLAVIYSWCVRSRWGAELWISATLLLLLRFCFSGLFMLTTELIQLKFYISILLGAQKRKYSFSFKVAIRSVCFGEQKISQGEYLVCCIWKMWCTFVCSPSESLLWIISCFQYTCESSLPFFLVPDQSDWMESVWPLISSLDYMTDVMWKDSFHCSFVKYISFSLVKKSPHPSKAYQKNVFFFLFCLVSIKQIYVLEFRFARFLRSMETQLLCVGLLHKIPMKFIGIRSYVMTKFSIKYFSRVVYLMPWHRRLPAKNKKKRKCKCLRFTKVTYFTGTSPVHRSVRHAQLQVSRSIGV